MKKQDAGKKPEAPKKDTATSEDEKIATWLDEGKPEVEAVESAPEPVKEVPAEEVEKTEPEATEAAPDKVGEPAEESNAEAEPEADPETDISDLLDEDGNVDKEKAKKFKKTYVNAQKLIGQTAKEREKLKRLPELEKDAYYMSQFRHLAANDPDFVEAVKRAEARARGHVAPAAQQERKPEPEMKPEDVEVKINDLMAKGKYADAMKLAKHIDPEFQEFKKARERYEHGERQRVEETRRQELAREVNDFQEKYEGVIFGPKKPDGHREIIDQELYDATYNEVNDHTPIENALAIASFKLGKLPKTKQPKTDPAKAQAASSARGARPDPTPKPRKGDDDEFWDMKREDVEKLLTR